MTQTHISPRARLHWKIGGLALLALGGIGIGQMAGWGKAGQPVAAPAKTVPATVARVGRRDMPIWISGIGSVTPINVVDVKVRVDGPLTKIAYAEGDEVAQGHLLAQIDPRPFQAVLAQAQAARARDVAQLANARLDATRTAALAQAGAGTSQAADAAKAQAAALQATVAADDATIRTAALNLQFCSIQAPIAGRVGLRQVNPGSMVHASDTTGIVTLTQMAPISVIFTLPQDALQPVLAGQGRGPLAVAVYSRDGATHLVDGQLVFVGSSVDQSTGQFQLRANFGNGNRALWPGEFVSARVLARTDRAMTVAPDQAVLTSETGRFVYVLKPDSTVDVRPVKVGASFGGFTEVLSGLAPGETIVVSGQSRLTPGARVTATLGGGAAS